MSCNDEYKDDIVIIVFLVVLRFCIIFFRYKIFREKKNFIDIDNLFVLVMKIMLVISNE